MKERPILFSGPMVRAILDRKKNQTRRIVKGKGNLKIVETPDRLWPGYEDEFGDWRDLFCPYGETGDRLWVRESFARSRYNTFYRCGNENFNPNELSEEWDWDSGCGEHWKPSIHMNRRYSRITLEITCVRVERLNEISEADAIAEGIESKPQTYGKELDWKYYGWLEKHNQWSTCPIRSYESLWTSINGPESWAANPFVWVIEFKRIEAT